MYPLRLHMQYLTAVLLPQRVWPAVHATIRYAKDRSSSNQYLHWIACSEGSNPTSTVAARTRPQYYKVNPAKPQWTRRNVYQ
jgi:hypothetical protein